MHPLRILMISQYGSGLANPEAQFSGAMSRQRDYASSVELYHMIVPSTEAAASFAVTENLTIHPVQANGSVDFLRKARKKAIDLHTEYTYTHYMVDNPHTAGLLGVTLKRALGIPFVLHSMSDMIKNPYYRKERLANIPKSWLATFAAKRADIIRVSTNVEVERLKKYSFSDKVVRVSFYVDQEDIKSQLEQIDTITKQNELLYVGRLGPQKDLAVLLKAMQLVVAAESEAKLTIVGGGPDEQMLKDLVTSLGVADNVIFTGPVPYNQVMRYFKEASAFAISSLHEGTCMVLHEAGLAKKPIVATSFAGAADLVEDGANGYLVNPRDVSGLAKKMMAILQNPGQAVTMGEENYRRVTERDRVYALAQWGQLCERMETVTQK